MDEKPKDKERSSFSRQWIFGQPASGSAIGVMETLDGWGYITAGVSFLVLGMVLFVHAWYVFAVTVGSAVTSAVLGLVHDLLLVIILLELFRTIINFLKTKIITLEPFLYVCIIASTRRILTTGAQIGSLEDLTDQLFHRYLLDVGANVMVIVALVIALYVVRKAPQRSTT
jgi:phosphate starvation-inducible membrane PsiE